MPASLRSLSLIYYWMLLQNPTMYTVATDTQVEQPENVSPKIRDPPIDVSLIMIFCNFIVMFASVLLAVMIRQSSQQMAIQDEVIEELVRGLCRKRDRCFEADG